MALKIKTPKLIINYLIVEGIRKNYIVPFKSGINIIYGDSDTGKSSILNLINYCLGANTLDLYEEIEIAGSGYCMIEANLKGETYTIRRDIFNANKDVEVYRSTFKEIDNIFPKYYSPNYNNESEDGYYSDFLLSSLNIPITKIKQSPSKADSSMVRLSFRDIFKYSYLDQDKVGAKKILGENYVYLVKLKETFKLMYNVLDTQISELDNLIAEKTKDRNELNKKNLSINSFLKETEVDTIGKLEEKKEYLELQLQTSTESLKKIDENILADSSELNSLRREIEVLEKELQEYSETNSIKEYELRQNIALKNEYSNDIKKMISTIEVLDKFPRIEDRDTNCPICEQTMKISELKEHFNSTDAESIKSKLNGLRRRYKGLRENFETIREQVDRDKVIISDKAEQLSNKRALLDNQTKEIITPYINQRDNLTSEIGSIKSELKNIKQFYKMRNQQASIEVEIVSLENSISELKDDLKNLKDTAPSIDRILLKLGDNLEDFLKYVGMKNVRNISISEKSFLPIIRSKEHEKITSGGVRTLSSVGYYLSLLKYSISNSVNYPSFLMIDTIAKYIGKTNDSDLATTDRLEDIEEGMNDSTKYEKLYSYLIELHNSYSDSFQMLIVDNDVPTTLDNKLKPFIIKHFTNNPTEGSDEIGLIDDVYKAPQKSVNQVEINEKDGKEEFLDFSRIPIEKYELPTAEISDSIDLFDEGLNIWEEEAIKYIEFIMDAAMVEENERQIVVERDDDNNILGFIANSIEELTNYLMEIAIEEAVNYMPNDSELREDAKSKLNAEDLIQSGISKNKEKLNRLGWT